MGIRLIKDGQGEYVRRWYGLFSIDGRKTSRKLGVDVRGRIPTDESGNYSLAMHGDEAFEASRTAAQTAFDRIVEKSKRDAKKSDAKYEAKLVFHKVTGKKFEDVPLDELAARWRGLPKRKSTSERWLAVCDKFFSNFATFAKSRKNGRRPIRTLNLVTQETAVAYFDHLSKDHTRETVKKQFRLLSSAFEQWATSGEPNPFAGFFSRSDKPDEIPHEPLSAEELNAVLEAAKDDPKVYPLAVVAAFTGLRLGDVCRLQWKDVDLDAGLIEVTTSKAKTVAVIPIIDNRLTRVLEAHLPADGKLTGYVFPDSAKDYVERRDEVTRSIKPYMARGLFRRETESSPAQIENAEPLTPQIVREALDGADIPDERRERIFDTFTRIKAGAGYNAIHAATGRAKSTISADLATIERLTGRVLRVRSANGSPSKTDLMRMTRQERKIGSHAASLFGWHSFRVAFITLALEAGIPIEDVKLIVGHTLATTTLRYFRPRLKHAAKRIKAKMARVLTCEPQPTKETIEVHEEPTRHLPAPAAEDGTIKRLRKLDELFAQGLISSDERDRERQRILAEI